MSSGLRLRCGKMVELLCQTGDLSGGTPFMNNTLGSCLLQYGNGLCKLILCLFLGFAGNGCTYLFDGRFYPGFVAHVSQSSDFVLLGSLDG